MSADLELRGLVERPEFRSKGGKLVAAGVAMKYGAKSKPIKGQFREMFQPGAFTESLRQQEVRSHLEHYGPYLGRTGAGTLRLFDSRSALAYEIDVPDTSAGRDAAALLERGDIKGSSIGFKAAPKGDSWSVDEHGMALRTVSVARLGLIDLTVAPAYDDSTAQMAYRSLVAQTGASLQSLVDADGRALAAIVGRSRPSRRLVSVGSGYEVERYHDASGRPRPARQSVSRRPLHWFV